MIRWQLSRRVKFAKENEKFSIVTGSIEGSVLSMDELKRLAELPSFDELRAKIVGLLKTPAMNWSVFACVWR